MVHIPSQRCANSGGYLSPTPDGFPAPGGANMRSDNFGANQAPRSVCSPASCDNLPTGVRQAAKLGP